MTAIHRWDKEKVIPKQRIRDNVRYGNGISGSSIYTPRRPYYEGDGAIDSIFNFFKNNQEGIKAIGNTVSSVADAVGKTSGTVIDIIKRKRELDKQGIENAALQEVLKAKPKEESNSTVSGSGFFFVN